MRGLNRRGAGRPAEGNEQHQAQAVGAAAGGDRRTRRRLLAGAAGVLGVAAAEVMGTSGPAQADNGNPVIQGADNGYPTHRTSVFTSGQQEWAQLADPGDAGLGSLGIYAHGQSYGVYADTGTNGTGVFAVGNGTGTGVVATGGSSGAAGVIGNAGGSGLGTGVEGNGGGAGGAGVRGSGGGTGAGVVGAGG